MVILRGVYRSTFVLLLQLCVLTRSLEYGAEVRGRSVELDAAPTVDKVLSPNVNTKRNDPHETHQTEKQKRMRIFQHDPVNVGYVRRLELEPGRFYDMTTAATNPPIFVIPNFVSDQECDTIIDLSRDAGLKLSITRRRPLHDNVNIDAALSTKFREYDVDGNKLLNITEMERFMLDYFHISLSYDEIAFILSDAFIDLDSNKFLDLEEFAQIPVAKTVMSNLITNLKKRPISAAILKKLRRGQDRKSTQTRLEHDLYDPDRKIRNRISALTRLHRDFVYSSELLHVVKYNRSGHYHGHTDSQYMTSGRVCEHVNHLYPPGNQPRQTRMCRFMTVLYYLNDPERGGQTAFPVADNETFSNQAASFIYKTTGRDIYDLTNHCTDGNVVVEPKRGTAVMWYNHYIDEESGWVDDLNPFSVHGGCEVIKGEKWIANHWINIDQNYDRQMAYIADRIRRVMPPPKEEPTDVQCGNETGMTSSETKSSRDRDMRAPTESRDEL